MFDWGNAEWGDAEWGADPLPQSTIAYNITNDEVRVVFPFVASVASVETLANYTLTPSSAIIKEVLIPYTETNGVSFVDLHITGLKIGETYTIVAANLFKIDGTMADDKTAIFEVAVTKSAKMLSGLPKMFNTAIGSLVRSLLLAIGLSDDQIGGNYAGQ